MYIVTINIIKLRTQVIITVCCCRQKTSCQKYMRCRLTCRVHHKASRVNVWDKKDQTKQRSSMLEGCCRKDVLPRNVGHSLYRNKRIAHVHCLCNAHTSGLWIKKRQTSKTYYVQLNWLRRWTFLQQTVKKTGLTLFIARFAFGSWIIEVRQWDVRIFRRRRKSWPLNSASYMGMNRTKVKSNNSSKS